MSIPTSISVRWGIAAGAAAILFALLFVSFNVFGQMQTPHPCDTTTVVSDQTNTGLIADCKVLWAGKDTFLGTNLRTNPQFNWNATTAIGSWTGIGVTMVTSTVPGSNPPVQRSGDRVTDIRFISTVAPSIPARLNGSLPTEFKDLTELTQLTVLLNSLTGRYRPNMEASPNSRV